VTKKLLYPAVGAAVILAAMVHQVEALVLRRGKHMVYPVSVITVVMPTVIVEVAVQALPVAAALAVQAKAPAELA
jgi:hypothetical protein